MKQPTLKQLPMELPNYRLIKSPRDSRLEDVPAKPLYRRSIKLWMVCALVWDYTDTILNQVTQMRISETKRLSREVKRLRSDFWGTLGQDLNPEQLANISELSLLFEEINREQFRKLHFGLKLELNKSELRSDYVMLVESVQMAMALVEAAYTFADECDKYIRRYYPAAPSSILPSQIRQLKTIIPSFAGNKYNPDSPTRKLTAKILVNELNKIDLYDDDGKI